MLQASRRKFLSTGGNTLARNLYCIPSINSINRLAPPLSHHHHHFQYGSYHTGSISLFSDETTQATQQKASSPHSHSKNHQHHKQHKQPSSSSTTSQQQQQQQKKSQQEKQQQQQASNNEQQQDSKDRKSSSSLNHQKKNRRSQNAARRHHFYHHHHHHHHHHHPQKDHQQHQQQQQMGSSSSYSNNNNTARGKETPRIDISARLLETISSDYYKEDEQPVATTTTTTDAATSAAVNHLVGSEGSAAPLTENMNNDLASAFSTAFPVFSTSSNSQQNRKRSTEFDSHHHHNSSSSSSINNASSSVNNHNKTSSSSSTVNFISGVFDDVESSGGGGGAASASAAASQASAFSADRQHPSDRRRAGKRPLMLSTKQMIYNRKVQHAIIEEQVNLKNMGIIYDVSEPVEYRSSLAEYDPDDLFHGLKDYSYKKIRVDIHKNELVREPEIQLVLPKENPTKVESITKQPPVEVLAHNLEQVVFEPGLHSLLNIDSYYNKYEKVYHFAPFLEKIHQPNEVNFSNLAPFVTTSRDEDLNGIAKKEGCTFKASTSSLSGPLTMLYNVLSRYRPTNADLLPSFRGAPSAFTSGIMRGKCVVLRKSSADENMWSIDSHNGIDAIAPANQILLDLGKSMEKMLVMEPERFQTQVLAEHTTISPDDREAYNYMKYGGIVIRSQLDCALREETNPLPDPFVFDIKTRAINEVRNNIRIYESVSDLRPQHINGVINSFEREFYDLIRTAFIKYSFQARIGSMQGMFMAYHNTLNIFGFEFISLAEMDRYTFGGTYIAEKMFQYTTALFETICNKIVSEHFVGSDCKAIKICMDQSFNSRDNVIVIYAEPMKQDPGWREKGQKEDNESELEGMTPNEREMFIRKSLHDAKNGEVFQFLMQIDAYVNGKYVDPYREYLHFNEGDKIDVTYKWKFMGGSSQNPSMVDSYINSLISVMFLDKE